mmetsp:Transcript_18739/g.16250  ORF Transcript_18739/g.16250 Transcript_18739/m.16250 type:complete len:114 (-) Transcript_18739:98-439(-)
MIGDTLLILPDDFEDNDVPMKLPIMPKKASISNLNFDQNGNNRAAPKLPRATAENVSLSELDEEIEGVKSEDLNLEKFVNHELDEETMEKIRANLIEKLKPRRRKACRISDSM